MKVLLPLLTLFMSVAHARVPVDYNQCSINQQRVLKSVRDFHLKKSKELVKRATLTTSEDEMSLEMKKMMLRLAQESFVKNLALIEVSEKMKNSEKMSDSLSSLKSSYEDSMKAKLYITQAAESFKDFARTYRLNSASLLSLTTELKNEIIERTLMSFASGYVGQLSDDELLVLGISTEIGVKATIEIGGRLIAAKAIGSITGASLFRWAGGPIGVVMFAAPLFMSGTLPKETQWTDLISDYPELLLEPTQMVKAKIANTTDEAMAFHCLAWERRAKAMNYLHQKLLKKIDSDIEQTISDIKLKYPTLVTDQWEGKAKRDNISVLKPREAVIKLRKK